MIWTGNFSRRYKYVITKHIYLITLLRCDITSLAAKCALGTRRDLALFIMTLTCLRGLSAAYNTFGHIYKIIADIIIL